MALTDQVAELTEKINTIETNTTALGEATGLIGDDVAALKRELEEANAKTNLDLSPLIAKAGSIGSAIGDVNTRLRNIAGPVAGTDPTETQPGPDTGTGSEG